MDGFKGGLKFLASEIKLKGNGEVSLPVFRRWKGVAILLNNVCGTVQW